MTARPGRRWWRRVDVVDHVVEERLGHVQQQMAAENATGVVDEDIDAAELVLDLGHALRDMEAVRPIGRHDEIARRPIVSISRAALVAPSWLARQWSATSAPSRASAMAVARPMPTPAPVTSAICPLSL